jgi:hypothetical protein
MKRFVAALSFFPSLCFSISSLAQWTTNGVPVCTLPETQVHLAIAPDGAGGIIMAWEDSRNLAGSGIDIYMQRLDGSGIPQWTASGAVLCSHTADQMFLTATADGAGGAIVVWVDRRSDPSALYAQRVDSNGSRLWATDGVMVCNGVPDVYFPVITSDTNGGAIVAWLDLRSSDPDVYAQRMSASGARLWGDGGAPVCIAAGLQHAPYLIADGAGGAIMAWGDERNDLGDIYAQRVNAAASPAWTLNGAPVCTATLRQGGGALVSDGLGGAIITWIDGRTSNNPNQRNIYAQRVDSAGAPQWPANGVPVCTAFGEQGGPAPVTDGAGGAVIAWHDFRAVNWDIYAQRVNSAGAALWTANGVALCAAPNTQWFPGLVSDGAGGAVVMWADFRVSADDDDIYAQRVSAAGSPMWLAEGVPVCTAPYIQHAPAIISDGAGGAIIAWDDTRSWDGVQPLDSFFDIFAARVVANGWVVSGTGDSPTARGLVLKPNFPNPFSGTTRLELMTDGTSVVAVDVFDVSGKRVHHEEIGRVEAGHTIVELDGRDQAGRLLPSGVYFCRVSAGAGRATQKIILMR